MSAGTGFGLIKAIIEEDCPFTTIVNEGIVSELFTEGPERQAFALMQRHRSSHSVYPDKRTIEIEVGISGAFDGLPTEPVSFWIEQMKQRHRNRELNGCLSRVRSFLEEGRTLEAINELGAGYIGLRGTYSDSHILDYAEGAAEVMGTHDEVQALATIPGIPFGFPYFDEISGGAQPGDSIILAGTTGVGKTYVALKMGHYAAKYAQKHVLVLSTEMPGQQVSRRVTAMDTMVDASDLKRGRLSYFVRQRVLREIQEAAESNRYFKILPGGIYSRMDDIELVTRELSPDLLLIDGASLVRIPDFRGGRWDRMIEVIERIKDLAMRQRIPILATYHLHEKGEGIGSVYGGQAMGQFASMFYSLKFERQEDRANPSAVSYRKLKLEKGRDGESGEVRILYDMGRSIIAQDSVISGYSFDSEEEPEVDAAPIANI